MPQDCHTMQRAQGFPATEKATTPSIDDCYRKALRLSSVLSAVAHLENEEARKEGRSALIFVAEEISTELEHALDAINTFGEPAA